MKGHAVPIANHAVVLPDELKKDVGLRIHLSPTTVIQTHCEPPPPSASPCVSLARLHYLQGANRRVWELRVLSKPERPVWVAHFVDHGAKAGQAVLDSLAPMLHTTTTAT